eukprot:701055-Ditylum_brightwellii.AAC.1
MRCTSSSLSLKKSSMRTFLKLDWDEVEEGGMLLVGCDGGKEEVLEASPSTGIVQVRSRVDRKISWMRT